MEEKPDGQINGFTEPKTSFVVQTFKNCVEIHINSSWEGQNIEGETDACIVVVVL